jgi:hypothetical protein
MSDPAEPTSIPRIAELAAGARPAEVSESAQRKLFEEWERAGGYIQRAEQMRLDAIKHQIQCAEAIVKKLGAGTFRYKDKLYMITVSKKGVVYLREAVARRKSG